jgi:hypothetical protein
MIEIKAYELCEHGHKVIDDTHYQKETTDAQIEALETARKQGARIRLFLGDETGKSWHSENDVVGRISRSMGPCKIPILVNNQRSYGGGAILTHCVVAIFSRYLGWIYKHENFTLPEITLEEITPVAEAIPGRMPFKDWQNYKILAKLNGEEHARFQTMKQAERWKDFMTAKRFTK